VMRLSAIASYDCSWISLISYGLSIIVSYMAYLIRFIRGYFIDSGCMLLLIRSDLCY
jgi:hypothetical protein